jgi:regulatory protein
VTGRRHQQRGGRSADPALPTARAASAGSAARTGNAGSARSAGSGGDAASAGSAGSGARAGRADRRSAKPHNEPPPRDPAELAREICLRQLAVRPRTRAELTAVLRRRAIPDEVVAEVLDRYGEVGIIDDQAFARAWVTSRHHGRGLARRALAGELRRKGVESEAVDEALDELDADTEAETARALVARRMRIERTAAPEVAFRRLVGMLARKGYPAGLAIRLVKEALAAEAASAEFADGIDPDALADAVDP